MPTHTEEERRRQQAGVPRSRAQQTGLLEQLGFGQSETSKRQVQSVKQAFGFGGQPNTPSGGGTLEQAASAGRPTSTPVTTPATVAPEAPTIAEPPTSSARDRILGTLTRSGQTQEFTGQQLQDRANSVNTTDIAAGNRALHEANAIRNQGTGGSKPGGGLDPIRQRLRDRVLGGGIGSRAALQGLLQLEEQDNTKASAAATAKRQGVLDQLGIARFGLEEQRLGLEQGREQRQVREELRGGITDFLSPQLESENTGTQNNARRIGSLATELASQAGGTSVDAGAAVAGAELISKVFSQATGRGIFDFSGPETLQTLSQAKDFTLVFDGNELDKVEFTDASGKQFKTNIDPGFFEVGGLSGAQAGSLVDLLKQFNQNVNIKQSR